MDHFKMINPMLFQNNFPLNKYIIFNKKVNLNNNINNSQAQDNDIKRLTVFEYNKNVNIYEDENYEFKQFTLFQNIIRPI